MGKVTAHWTDNPELISSKNLSNPITFLHKEEQQNKIIAVTPQTYYIALKGFEPESGASYYTINVNFYEKKIPLLNEFLIVGNNGVVTWEDYYGNLKLSWEDVSLL